MITMKRSRPLTIEKSQQVWKNGCFRKPRGAAVYSFLEEKNFLIKSREILESYHENSEAKRNVPKVKLCRSFLLLFPKL